jgi:DNA-directed RNA polymerase specialized sigma24 family protein|tara:strand:- start:946 stop:1419 length:474 start_codon:yes stop_codon:yes gene_type:complete
MVQKTMILIAKKHQTWIDIVCTFGCTRTTAEDLVQEMYYKIQLKIEDGLNIMYQDEINYYYIFKTLKTLFIDLKRKGKNITIVTLDDVNLTSNDINYIESYDKIQEALKQMYWYDRKVFEVINQGESIAEFSRKSFIHYYSLYNTYHKVKSKLKKLL